MVEYLKVQFTYWVGGLMVEPAYASLTVEPAYASLSVEPLKGPLLNSRACLRILNSRAPTGPLLISRVTNVPGHGGS